MLFAKKITFAILNYSQNWKTELTRKTVDYYRMPLNGLVISAQNVNDALSKCRTKYLLIQRSGGVILSDRFLYLLEQQIEKDEDIFIGNIHMMDDYAALDDDLLFINMELWKKHGSIRFDAKITSSPVIIRSEEMHKDHYPVQVTLGEFNTTIDLNCLERGAALIVKQANIFGKTRAFSKEQLNETFFFRSSTLYETLKDETRFETEIIPRLESTVHVTNSSTLTDLRNVSTDIAIVAANGLNTINLIKAVHAKSAIIYSPSDSQLALQRRLIGIERAINYENALNWMLSEYPATPIIGQPRDVRATIIHPHPLESVKFVKISPVGHQLEELILGEDVFKSMVVDVGDFYASPLCEYRRTRGSVAAFFEMLYSKFSSRPGPSFLLGFDPFSNFINLIQTNDRRWCFEAEQLDEDDSTN